MKYFVIIIFTIASLNLFAQQKQFTLNEDGKYIYYEVIVAKGLNRDSLMRRAEIFINKLHKRNIKQESATDTSILAKGKMVIDKTVLIAGHPSGEVSYDLTFEARDGRYRFWLTNFDYIAYKRDRYGNYVASTTIGTPLEKSPSKLNIAEWRGAVEASYQKVEKLSGDFKKFLNTKQLVMPLNKPKSVLADKW